MSKHTKPRTARNLGRDILLAMVLRPGRRAAR